MLITNSLHFSGTVWSGTTSLSPTGKSDILKVVFSFWKFSIRFCNHFWNINVNNYMNCRRELNVSESGLFSLRLTEIFLNNNWLFLRWPRKPLPIPKCLLYFRWILNTIFNGGLIRIDTKLFLFIHEPKLKNMQIVLEFCHAFIQNAGK